MLKPFFSYFGGKYRIARRYPAPEHKTLVEPFAGGAGYALRYYDRDVVLIEKYPTLAAVWRYLIEVRPDEIRRLPLLEPLESVDDKIWPCEEAKHLVGLWVHRANTRPAKTHTPMIRRYWDLKPGSRWSERSRDRIASQVDKIRHWRVIEGGYEDAPDITATWFVDPPYEVAGKSYVYGSKLSLIHI